MWQLLSLVIALHFQFPSRMYSPTFDSPTCPSYFPFGTIHQPPSNIKQFFSLYITSLLPILHITNNNLSLQNLFTLCSLLFQTPTWLQWPWYTPYSFFLSLCHMLLRPPPSSTTPTMRSWPCTRSGWWSTKRCTMSWERRTRDSKFSRTT